MKCFLGFSSLLLYGVAPFNGLITDLLVQLQGWFKSLPATKEVIEN